MILSVDVGFGDVKSCSGDGFACVKFPSAIAPYSFGGATHTDGDGLYREEKVYEFEGQSYLIGEQALLDSNCKTTRSPEFIVEYSPLFVYKAKELLSVSEIERLAVGIPLGMFVNPAMERFKTRYRERLAKFIVNGELIEPAHVDVFAQGHGIYIDYLIKEQKIDSDETVLVVDVGFNTIDMLAVVKGKPNKKNSQTLRNKGVVKIIADLQSYLQDNFMLELSEQAVKDILLKRALKVYGDVKDLSDVIDTISENYASWFFGEIKSQKDDFLQTADKLVIAGGGAYFLKNAIPPEYKGFVYIPENPEFANARGYYKLSELLA